MAEFQSVLAELKVCFGRSNPPLNLNYFFRNYGWNWHSITIQLTKFVADKQKFNFPSTKKPSRNVTTFAPDHFLADCRH